MRQSTDSLLERARGRKIVLGVDDAQLLDPVSAALVLHLTTTASAFVIATVRSGEPCPDAIVSLWKDAGAHRIELQRLSDEAVATLVEAALGGPVEQAALRWLVESSQGNALYVRELVPAAVENGTLARSRGLWRLTGPPAVSASLIELVSRRMAGLGAELRAPLELLALGEPLRLDEVTALSDYGALVEAESLGLLVVDPAGMEVRLGASRSTATCSRRELPVLRAREQRLRVAETLQRRDPLTPDVALRVARLLLDAAPRSRPASLVDAARAANLAGDPELGAQLARARRCATAAGCRRRSCSPAPMPCASASRTRRRCSRRPPATSRRRRAASSTSSSARTSSSGASSRPAEAEALLEARAGLVAGPRLAAPARAAARELRRARRGVRRRDRPLRALVADPALDGPMRLMAERRLALSLFFAGRTRESHALAREVQPVDPARRLQRRARARRLAAARLRERRRPRRARGHDGADAARGGARRTTTRRPGRRRSASATRASSPAATATRCAGTRRPSCTSRRRTPSGR